MRRSNHVKRKQNPGTPIRNYQLNHASNDATALAMAEFERIDVNGDGVIDREEWGAAQRKVEFSNRYENLLSKRIGSPGVIRHVESGISSNSRTRAIEASRRR